MNGNISELVKKNIRFVIAMLFVIALGIFGLTYAVKIARFNNIDVNIDTANIIANISYDSGYSNTVVSDGQMMPISDNLVTGPNASNTNILKTSFNIYGDNSNPENTIYDIAIHDFVIDCELKNENVKWRLYKNGSLLSYGSLSPEFDIISGDRLVLTTIQQDLTTNSDNYVFLLWISESCNSTITNCLPSQNQNNYLGKSLSGTIKVETSTKTKKTLTRVTSSEEFICDLETDGDVSDSGEESVE